MSFRFNGALLINIYIFIKIFLLTLNESSRLRSKCNLRVILVSSCPRLFNLTPEYKEKRKRKKRKGNLQRILALACC
jgi:hypothetical protein